MHGKTRLLIVILVAIGVLLPVAVIAKDNFTDVPDTNVFHDDISWLKNAGVTVGCNPPANDEFCPTDNVSRQQMAAFMRRFAKYIGAEDGVPDEADTVDGFHAADLASRAAFNSDELSGTVADAALDATIEAPARGTLVMNGAVDITLGSLDTVDTVICELLVDGLVVAGTTMFAAVGNDSTFDDSNENICSTTGAFVVDAGSHTATFNIRDVDDALLYDMSVNVIWVPFDGSGAVPTSAANPTAGNTSGK